MVRGMYSSGTGMLLQRRMMETVTHNITNADTTGYKKEHIVSHSFDDVLIKRINDTSVVGMTRITDFPLAWRNGVPVGPLNFGTHVDQIYVNHDTGSFEETGVATDLAVAGDVFFAVETAAGERYTKAGAFIVNPEGWLTDHAGNYVLGENGRINVGGDSFSVNSAGDIYVAGSYVDRLRLVSFEDTSALRKEGDNLFRGGEPQEAGVYEVLQGFLENSNVEIGREMVDMLTVYRAYEANQRILTMTDETVGKAVNEIGRLR